MTAKLRLWPAARAVGISLAAALVLIPFGSDGDAAEAAPAGVTATAAAPGLVAAYAFEASSGAAVADSSGNGHHGTGTGGVWTSAGKYGHALKFNGANATTQVPDHAALDLAAAMTLEAWVYPQSVKSDWRTVVVKERESARSYGLYGGSSRGRSAGIADIGGAEETAMSSKSLPLRSWSHLAATYDGSRLRLYVNGVLTDTETAAGSITTGDGPLRIGGSPVLDEWFNGTIDELRVYNRALGSSEIQTDMTTPIAPTSTGDTQAPSTPGGLSVTTTTGTSITLGWSASSDNVAVAGYGLYRNGASVGSTAAGSYTFSGLTCATSYTLAADAYDGAGNRSGKGSVTASTSACAPAGDTQAPTVPTGLAAASSTTTSISVAWNASTDNVGVSGYALHNNGNPVGSTAARSYVYTGLACGTSYTLAVDAYDAVGNHSGKASIAAATSPCTPAGDTQAPTVPTGLVAATPTATSISVTWNASSDTVGVSGYGLYRNTTSLGTTATRSYSFDGLTCGTSYTLAVDAYDAAGNRSAKASVSATTSACPPAPPVGGLVPPARANTVVNAPSGTRVQSDTYYRDPQGSLSYPNGIQRVTVVGAKQMPGYVNDWQDVWIEGKPDAYMNLGPGVDVDLMQIKRSSSSVPPPSNLTFRYFRMHDLSRTGDKHTDGLQLMAGRNIRFIDGVSENVDVQPFFARDSGSTAGGGPIEDILFQRVTVTGTGGYYAFRISGNDEAATGGNVPTRVKIVDCAGDKGVSIDSAAAKLGSEAINYRKL